MATVNEAVRKTVLPPGPERESLRFMQFEESLRCPYRHDPEALLIAKTFGQVDSEDGEEIGPIDGVRFAQSDTDLERMPDDSEKEFFALKRRILKLDKMPSSPRFDAAVAVGEEWTKHATPKDIFRLPSRKWTLALLYRYWAGMTFEAISSTLGWGTKEASMMAVRRAKKVLAFRG